LRVILETLEHTDLIQLILSYLLSLHEEIAEPEPMNPFSARKRRESLDMISEAAEQSNKPTPELYSLVDLVLTNLKSKSQLTVNATLRLVSTLLQRHHPYTLSTLLSVSRSVGVEDVRTIGALNGELEHIFSLVRTISPDEDYSSESYEAYLQDHLVLLESHPCTMTFLASKLRVSNPLDDQTREVYKHNIRLDDVLLSRIVSLFKTFFSNAVETNLFLTSLLIDLATCCQVSLSGWLLVDPLDYQYNNESDLDSDVEDDMIESPETLVMKKFQAIKRAKRRPNLTRPSIIIKELNELVDQISIYKKQV